MCTPPWNSSTPQRALHPANQYFFLLLGPIERRGIPGASFVEHVQTYLTQLSLDATKPLSSFKKGDPDPIRTRDDLRYWTIVSNVQVFDETVRLARSLGPLSLILLSSHMQIQAKDLEILWKDDPEQWEIVTEGRDDVAHLIGCHYFLVAGSIPECELDQGANYQVSFLVKGTPGSKTDNHVSLMIQAPGKGWLKNEKNIPMNGEWADIATEKVRVNGSSSKLRFYMTNSNNSEKKGLYVHSATIKRVP